MAFIRCRQSNRAKSYQFVETYREDGKVKQRVLANLGPYPTVELALENARRCVARAERYVEHCKHGWTRRGRPVHPKHLSNAEKDLARHCYDLERLEAVVSETSRRREVIDTTPSAKLRRSVVRLDKRNVGRLSNHHISGLQGQLLVTMLLKRVPGARGCDASHPELLVEVWGWKPRRPLRWSEEHASKYAKDHYRHGDTVPSGGMDSYGMFPSVPRKEYRSARASLARALTRLYKRGLIEFVNGTIGTYSGGPVLTPAGEKIARLLAYPTVQRAEGSAGCR